MRLPCPRPRDTSVFAYLAATTRIPLERLRNISLAKLIRDPRLIGAVITSGLFFLGWNLIPQHTMPEYPMGQLLPFVLAALASLGMIAVVWLTGEKPHLYLRLTQIFALGMALGVVGIWGKLEFGPGGVSGDSWFISSMIAKFKHTWANTDFVYPELHSFYPPLFHYVMGKLAWITGTDPWSMLNVGMTLTTFFLPWGIYAMWKQVVEERLAFIFMVVAMYASVDSILFKPYEVISMTIFIPWALRFLEFGRGKMSKRELLWGGLIGAALFMTYYYYFFLLIPFLPLRTWIDWRSHHSRSQLGNVWRGYLRLFGWMMLFSIPYWLPLMYDILRFGMQSFQNRWFQPYMVAGPYGTGEEWWIILGLLVVVALTVREKLARGLTLLLVAQLLWLLLAYIGMLLDTPLLHMRIFGLTRYLAWMGLAWGVVLLGDQIKQADFKPFKGHLPVALAVLFAFFVAQELHQDRKISNYKLAKKSELPALPWFPAFREKAKDKVFLTNRYDLSAYRPLYHFIAHNAHFSHPASRFRERLKFLSLLSKSGNAGFVSTMMRNNKFVPIDYLILDDRQIKIYDDNFPDWNAHTEVKLEFKEEVLSGPGFSIDPEFPEMIVVDNPGGGVASWSAAERAVAAVFGDAELSEKLSDAANPAEQWLRREVRPRVKDYRRWAAESWKSMAGMDR
jgi:galactan 5-O-arabinofuranosyltransferase